jgi:hypothetical protein
VVYQQIGSLEDIFVRTTHRHLLDDPLGHGTITSFFDRSIPLK